MSKKIEWKIEKRKVLDLTPADYNPRVLSDKQKADLTKSVDRFGQAEPLVINTNNKIIGGHSRLKVFADLGMVDCDVMVPSRKLSVEEEKELNVRLNKNTGEWDYSKMKEFFNIEDLEQWGFEMSDVKAYFGLSDANDLDVDEERMQVLMVQPPESPKLKERAMLRFKQKVEYDQVKKWLLDGNMDKAVLVLIKMSNEKA